MRNTATLFRTMLVLSITLVMAIPLVHAQRSAFTTLTVAGGPTGGAWFGLAGGVAEQVKKAFPNLLVSVQPGGGVGNVTLVENGRAHMGITVAHLYRSAMEGKDPYAGNVHRRVRALAEIGISDMGLFFVREGVPINSIQALKDRRYPLRLTTTTRASTPALAAERLLNAYGITFDDLKSWGGSVTFISYADATSLIADGHADAIISPVVPAIVELTRRTPMKWLAPSEKVVDQLVARYGYAKNQVPQGKYDWAKADAWTIGEPNIIVVRDEVPDDVVYGITKALAANPEVVRQWGAHHKLFDPEKAWANVGGPLHPGAERFYREAGYLK
jgi:uncharacterized protein